jgi:hypothetical protein
MKKIKKNRAVRKPRKMNNTKAKTLQVAGNARAKGMKLFRIGGTAHQGTVCCVWRAWAEDDVG